MLAGRRQDALDYALWILAMTPFVLAAILVGLLELVVRTDGRAAAWVARPFLRAVERKRSRR